MTQTPKTPLNPFDFLAAALGDQKAGGGPVIFDLLGGPRPAGGAPKNSGVEDVLGLFQHLARDFAPESEPKTEKPTNTEAPARPEAKCDKRPTAHGDVAIQIPLPGIPKENIDIEVGSDTIVIRTETPEYVEVPAGKRHAVHREILPLNVDIENITSTYKDGLLTINLPAIKPTKVKIDISEG